MAPMSIRTFFGGWCASLLVLALFVGGCGPNNRPYGVPFKGDLVAEAAGKTASFTAPHNGQIWIAGPGHPGQERYIVFSGLIKFGQTVTIDMDKHEVTMNSEKQKAEIAGGNSYYQLWYVAGSDD
jgi:hypothetical protein